jgi:hypothetical protein
MWGLLLGVAVAGAAETGAAPPFELAVLEGRWDAAEWGYEEPPPPDAKAPRIFTAVLDDVDRYRWASQAFVLTAAATGRLVAALAGEPGPGGSIETLSVLKGRLGHGSAFERRLYLHRFVVSVEGAPLYWGIFLDPPSQMAIDYPVMRASLADGRAVFHVLPVHLPFFSADPGAPSAQPKTSAEADGVPGGMIEHLRMAAGASTAVAFRGRIRDVRLRQVLKKRLDP